jgi:hypothetical protein
MVEMGLPPDDRERFVCATDTMTCKVCKIEFEVDHEVYDLEEDDDA